MMTMQKRKEPIIFAAQQYGVHSTQISPAALSVVKRLQKAGFSAYIVGGGIRDLLAKQAPKDFDVVTDAHPEQIRPLFKRCLLIGKRFRLAHVYVNHEIIEVATFRAAPTSFLPPEKTSTGKMILRDNVFGTIEEDAWRRDFTINALYYDPIQETILDYCHGIQDLIDKKIRILGDPQQRYQEDPVRLLRALRLSAKLEFTLEKTTAAPISTFGYLLHQVAAARLFDEVLKMYLGGHAEKTFQLCLKYDIFKYLFPATMACFTANTQAVGVKNFIIAALKNSDERIAQNKSITPTFFLAAMLWYPLLNNFAKEKPQHHHDALAFESAIWQTLKKQQPITAIPKYLSNGVLEIWRLQWRLEKRKRATLFKIITHARFRAAYDFLLLRTQIDSTLTPLTNWWTTFYEANSKTQMEMAKKV